MSSSDLKTHHPNALKTYSWPLLKRIPVEKVGKYFWSFFGVIGIVLLWAGIWDGIGSLPFISNPLISLIVGICMLSFSGLLVKEFNPLNSSEGQKLAMFNHITRHPLKHEFHAQYYDNVQKKHLTVHGHHLQGVEKDTYLVLHENNKEVFVPIRRIKKIYHKNRELTTVKHVKDVKVGK